jgi:hypothetical protein
MPKDPAKQSKRDALKRHGTLNPDPAVVTDALFQTGNFFDADDLVQVKYEMLRRVRVDKQSVSQSASAFGFHAQLIIRRRKIFSGMVYPVFCRRNEALGKATNSRPIF